MKNLLGGVVKQATAQTKNLRKQHGTIWQIEGDYTATGGEGKLLAYTQTGETQLNGQGTIAQQKQAEGNRLAQYMTERDSQVIDAVSYDAKTRIVSVTFPSGATYEYNNISLEMLKQWAYAPSLGGYFTRFIRPYFIYGK